jgi:rod shape determining protein RodA
MGVLRVERTAATGLAAKASGVTWRDYDIQLTVYAVLLAAIGLAMAYSHTTAALGEALVAGTTFARGLVWAGLALAIYAAVTVFDYRWLRTLTWPIYVANLALLGATIFLGDSDAASSRWISIAGFQFQFSELAKILMILVLARYLADRERRLDSLGTILGACLVVAPAWVLVMIQPDLGTSLVFLAILGGMLFIGGASVRWLAALGAAALAAVPLAWTYVLHDYQKERLTSFLDPASDPLGAGFQLLTAQQAVASGRVSRTVPRTSPISFPSRRPTSSSPSWPRSSGSSAAWSCSCCSPPSSGGSSPSPGARAIRSA